LTAEINRHGNVSNVVIKAHFNNAVATDVITSRPKCCLRYNDLLPVKKLMLEYCFLNELCTFCIRLYTKCSCLFN